MSDSLGEPANSLLVRAQGLESKHALCQRILESANTFCAQRWVSPVSGRPGTFVDTPATTVVNNRHLVNSSSALSVISRNRQVFDTPGAAFGGLEEAEVLNFFMGNDVLIVSSSNNHYWKSQTIAVWSPYVTATVLLALADYASYAKEKGTTDLTLFHSHQSVFFDQAQKLLEFLRSWSKSSLESGYADYDHVFFAYVALEALSTLDSVASSFLPLPSPWLGPEILTGVQGRMLQEFYKQMTFAHATLQSHIDPASLGLSLYCLTRHTDGRCLPDDALDLGIDAFFKLQQPTGYWDTSTPLLGAATGKVGCSSVELAMRLLQISRVEARLLEFCENYDKILLQILRGFDKEHPERGWPVDVRRNGNERQTWYGFFVYEFVTVYAQKLKSAAGDLVLRSFRYSTSRPKRTWSELYLYDEVRARVDRRVIGPRKGPPRSPAPACSMILFGPPGTGKTSFAAALAHELGWGLIEIGPGDFLKHGVNRLFEQGDLIFQRLLLLSRVVVLFDEIDEFVEDRTDRTSEKISRFVTTYMLPWVQRLRDKATIVFIFATNHLDKFDSAIKRPGRFDLIVPIGPPMKQHLPNIFKLMKLPIDEADISAFADVLLDETSYGDIERARDAILDKNAASRGAEFLEAMKGWLLVSENLVASADWAEFKKERDKYL